MVPPPSQNTVIKSPFLFFTILFLGWWPFLKSLMPLYKSLIFFILLLVSRSQILAFIFPSYLFLKCLLSSHLTLFRLCTLLCFVCCNSFILACFLWTKKPKHSSWHYGLCCFKLYRPRLSWAEVLILSLMFSQALFMSLLSFKFSKAAKPTKVRTVKSTEVALKTFSIFGRTTLSWTWIKGSSVLLCLMINVKGFSKRPLCVWPLSVTRLLPKREVISLIKSARWLG